MDHKNHETTHLPPAPPGYVGGHPHGGPPRFSEPWPQQTVTPVFYRRQPRDWGATVRPKVWWTAALAVALVGCFIWMLNNGGFRSLFIPVAVGTVVAVGLVVYAILMVRAARGGPTPQVTWIWLLFLFSTSLVLAYTAVAIGRFGSATFICGISILFSEGGIHCG